MASHQQKFSGSPQTYFINDRPSDEDQLGAFSYVRILVSMIHRVSPPFTLGIYGATGTGKSFFLRLLQRELSVSHRPVVNQSHQSSWNLLARLQRWRGRPGWDLPLIWFDAPAHPVELVGVQLVHYVIRALEHQLSIGQKIRLINRQSWQYYYQRFRWWLFPLLLVILAAELIIIYRQVSPQVQLDLPLLLVLLSSGAIAGVVGVIQGVVAAAKSVFQVESVYPAEQPKRFWQAVSFASAPDPKRDATVLVEVIGRLLRGRKVVVFVDLGEDTVKAKEVLDWIQLLHEARVFIVVIALDPEKAAEAIAEQMRKSVQGLDRVAAAIEKIGKSDPGLDLAIGRSYLQRRVHLPFYIPPPNMQALRHYLDSLIAELGELPRDSLAPVLPFLSPDPRTLQQLLIQYRASFEIAHNMGIIYESNDWPAKIIKWLVLGQRWPSVVNLIAEHFDELPTKHSTGTALSQVVEHMARSGVEIEDSALISQLLSTEPVIFVQDVGPLLHITSPFIARETLTRKGG